MVGWHHQHNGHEFEQNLGDSEGQGSPAAYNAVVHGVAESDMTQQLNNNNNGVKASQWFQKTSQIIREENEGYAGVL